MFKKIDLYIIKKYLGTYIFSIVLIISVSVVLDLTEKLDNFFDNDAPLKAIVFDYYMNFIPYFTNLFTPLFTFISVIFFTSNMAYKTEIIAILSSGISFNRMLRPYFFSAACIAVFSFVLSGYIIPPANKTRLDFEDKYIQKFTSDVARNIQMEVDKGIIAYIERFEEKENKGYRFSLEKFEGKTLVSRLTAQSVQYDSLNHWKVNNYLIRDFDGLKETITKGSQLDTVIHMQPSEFFITAQQAAEMKNHELRRYIESKKERGLGGIQAFQDEYYKRFSMPLASLILTLIGVSLSSRKVRGGMGLHIGVGIALSAIYILFSTLSTSFAVKGSLSPLLAVWLPNIIFLLIGLYLYRQAPK